MAINCNTKHRRDKTPVFTDDMEHMLAALDTVLLFQKVDFMGFEEVSEGDTTSILTATFSNTENPAKELTELKALAVGRIVSSALSTSTRYDFLKIVLIYRKAGGSFSEYYQFPLEQLQVK